MSENPQLYCDAASSVRKTRVKLLKLIKYAMFYDSGKETASQIDSIFSNEIIEKIHITVAGVPKKGAKALKSLNDFRDNFVFKYEDTGKNLVAYNDEQEPVVITDYLGNELYVEDKSGMCLLPNTYELSKAQDYAMLISDASSKRARYKEV